jgi:hypothetical protein
MIYLLAGNAAQAANYCREHGIGLRDASYVSSPVLLRGLAEPDYAVVGTFWDHVRAIEIWKTLLSCYAGSKKPLPQAPPAIQQYLRSTHLVPANIVIGPNAGFVTMPGDPELEPIEDDPEPEPPKKKKFSGFKSIRK